MNEKIKELKEVNMATGIVKVFTELMSTVLNGRADVDFKVIIFTFGIDFFPLCSIKQDFIHSFLFKQKQEGKAATTGDSQTNGNKLSLILSSLNIYEKFSNVPSLITTFRITPVRC